MHRHVFSRAMRKQGKRLEKDAKALEKARRHAGKGKYRASTIMGWKGGGYAGLREECARRNAIAERRRAAEREARREREREGGPRPARASASSSATARASSRTSTTRPRALPRRARKGDPSVPPRAHRAIRSGNPGRTRPLRRPPRRVRA